MIFRPYSFLCPCPQPGPNPAEQGGVGRGGEVKQGRAGGGEDLVSRTGHNEAGR